MKELKGRIGYVAKDVVDLNIDMKDYYTKEEVDKKTKLPVASTNTLGGVKVGAGLAINNGVLSATGEGTADAVEWNNVLNKPTLSTVATSGSYKDLNDKPTIPNIDGYATEEWVETRGYLTEHQDIEGKVNKTDLANVAFSGNYSDLKGKPTIPEGADLTGYATENWVESQGYLTEHQSLANYALKSEIPSLTGYVKTADLSTVATSGSYEDLTNKPNLFSGNYQDLTNKPTIPEPYTLPVASTDTLGGVKVDGSTITIADGVISSAGGGSSGGGAEPDGKTIITNADGKLETVIGGYKVLADPPNETIYTNESSSSPLVSISGNDIFSGKENFPTGFASYARSDKEYNLNQADKIKHGVICYVSFDIYLNDKPKGQVIRAKARVYEESNLNYKLIVAMDNDGSKPFIGFWADWICLTTNYEAYTIKNVVIVSEDQYNYHKIDSNYINYGDTLYIDNGKLQMLPSITTLSLDGYAEYIGDNIILNKRTKTTIGGNNKNIRNNVIMNGDVPNINTNKTFTYNTIEGNAHSNMDYLASTHIEGEENKINIHSKIIRGAHMEGYLNTLGNSTNVINQGIHIEGQRCEATGLTCHVEGYSNIAQGTYQHVQGKYNMQDNAGTYADIVGNGTSDTRRANALTLDWNGNLAIAGTMSSAGADYAEFFEWKDGNPEAEDRVGYIVSLDGDKLTFANEGDYILGVVSGTATVLGDNPEWNWAKRWITDEFGRIQYEDKVIHHEDKNENDEIETWDETIKAPIVNPDYDPDQEYTKRADRPEWSAVGMMGKLYVRDDGTCQVNGYAKPINGVATASTSGTMRVIERVSDNVIRVVIK